MQSLTDLMEWLEASSLAVYIHKTAWAFTTIELIHVFAISLVIGTIAIVDLRLLGLASTKRPFTELSRRSCRTRTAFVVAVIAGSLLFVSQATACSPTPCSDQMLIVLAGINTDLRTITARARRNGTSTRSLQGRRGGPGGPLACWV